MGAAKKLTKPVAALGRRAMGDLLKLVVRSLTQTESKAAVRAEMNVHITFGRNEVPVAQVVAVLQVVENAAYETEREILGKISPYLTKAELQKALALIDATRKIRCRVVAVGPGSLKLKVVVFSVVASILASTASALTIVEKWDALHPDKVGILQNKVTDGARAASVNITGNSGVVIVVEQCRPQARSGPARSHNPNPHRESSTKARGPKPHPKR